MSAKQTCGFTLIELAVVLVLVAIVLGGLLVPLSSQIDARKVREARVQLAEIKEALIGFALAKGRLPCPATAASNGLEARLTSPTRCNAGFSAGKPPQHGFVPGRTLGLSGSYNEDQLLLDPWGGPYRYSVTATNENVATGNLDWDFVTSLAELRSVGMTDLDPDLRVCATNINGNNCDVFVADAVPVIFYSLGPDARTYLSFGPVPKDELENAGESTATPITLNNGKPPPNARTYPIAGDTHFVSRTRSDDPGDQFDDVVDWISPNVIYYRMISAGLLP